MGKSITMDEFKKILHEFDFSDNIIGEYSSLSLAFIGDSIYDLYVRTYILSKGNMTPRKLHKLASGYVRASTQSKIMLSIIESLNDEEKDVIKRGRNAKSGNVPKNADVIEYRNATGLESLFGYLYLSNKMDRLCELLKISISIIDKK